MRKTQSVLVEFELPEGYVPFDYPGREKTFEALITGILSDFRIQVTRVEFIEKECDEDVIHDEGTK